MELREQILPLFSGRVRKALERASPDFENLREIRLRAEQPMMLLSGRTEYFLSEDGRLVREHRAAMRPSYREIQETFASVCGYSGYAYEEEISRGYITVAGGHRIGLSGRAVLREGSVLTLKQISCLNVRVAHPVSGCAERWKDYFYQKGRPCHVLIISPPGCGKTTLLRDAVRMFSDGSGEYAGVTVGVVDERSEIAGSYRGLPSMPLGMRTDVLDGCPKREGMEMLLRSMSPDVLAADELGSEDVPAIERALRCGCRIIATLHGEGLADFLEKPGFQKLAGERVFERYFFFWERGRFREKCVPFTEKIWKCFGRRKCVSENHRLPFHYDIDNRHRLGKSGGAEGESEKAGRFQKYDASSAGELRFHHAALFEAFENVSGRVKEPFREFLREISRRLEERSGESFENIFAEEVKKLLTAYGFHAADAQLLEMLGVGLGYLDLELQTETLNQTIFRTEEALAAAKEEQKRKGRLYQTMGVTAGAVLALLII